MDMKINGFKKSDRIERNVEVALGASGEILLIDGRHRLIFAKILGVKKIPVVANLISEQIARSFVDKPESFGRQLSINSVKLRLEECFVLPSYPG